MKARRAPERPRNLLIDPLNRPCPLGCGYVSENELDLGVHYRAAHPRVFAMKGPGKKGKEPPQNDPKPGPLLEDEDHEEENWG